MSNPEPPLMLRVMAALEELRRVGRIKAAHQTVACDLINVYRERIKSYDGQMYRSNLSPILNGKTTVPPAFRQDLIGALSLDADFDLDASLWEEEPDRIRQILKTAIAGGVLGILDKEMVTHDLFEIREMHPDNSMGIPRGEDDLIVRSPTPDWATQLPIWEGQTIMGRLRLPFDGYFRLLAQEPGSVFGLNNLFDIPAGKLEAGPVPFPKGIDGLNADHTPLTWIYGFAQRRPFDREWPVSSHRDNELRPGRFLAMAREFLDQTAADRAIKAMSILVIPQQMDDQTVRDPSQ